MKKVLFILNKYCGLEETESFYPEFLINFQKQSYKYKIDISYAFFSKNLININVENKCIYDEERFNNLSKEDLKIQANRIEKEYRFTFKQSLYPDILQTFNGQDGKQLSPPKALFNDLSYMVPRFLFLEKIIKNNNYDVIFSDTSPEYEMEFGRLIGNKLNKIILKEMLGSALGNSIICRCNNFGEFKWIEAKGDKKFDLENTRLFIEDFKNLKKPPYKKYFTSSPKINFLKKFKNKTLGDLFILPFILFKKLINNLKNFINEILKKIFLYNKLSLKEDFLFFGFHLLTESSVTYRSLPYSNQIMIIEMISRVLPYNHYLYVREHPHWSDKYTFKFLKGLKSLPNVKIISPEISIHDILSQSKGVISLTSTTGIEALMYGKPVLSFCSNIYAGYHSSVIKCENLFNLGNRLTELINTKVNHEETISYIDRVRNNSVSVALGSYNFYSLDDSQKKSIIFVEYFKNVINSL